MTTNNYECIFCKNSIIQNVPLCKNIALTTAYEKPL